MRGKRSVSMLVFARAHVWCAICDHCSQGGFCYVIQPSTGSSSCSRKDNWSRIVTFVFLWNFCDRSQSRFGLWQGRTCPGWMGYWDPRLRFGYLDGGRSYISGSSIWDCDFVTRFWIVCSVIPSTDCNERRGVFPRCDTDIINSLIIDPVVHWSCQASQWILCQSIGNKCWRLRFLEVTWPSWVW